MELTFETKEIIKRAMFYAFTCFGKGYFRDKMRELEKEKKVDKEQCECFISEYNRVYGD